MSAPWAASVEDVEKRLKAEALAVSKQLGHRMSDWFIFLAEKRAVCLLCREIMIVRLRSWKGSNLSGGAIELRCKGP